MINTYKYNSLELMFDYCSSCLWVKNNILYGHGGMITAEELRLPKRIAKKINTYYDIMYQVSNIYFFQYGRFDKESNLLIKLHNNSFLYKKSLKLRDEILRDLYTIYGRRFNIDFFDESTNLHKNYKKRV